jgi:hypothetical protein
VTTTRLSDQKLMCPIPSTRSLHSDARPVTACTALVTEFRH